MFEGALITFSRAVSWIERCVYQKPYPSHDLTVSASVAAAIAFVDVLPSNNDAVRHIPPFRNVGRLIFIA
jgi:hypothetical protein